MLALGKMIFKVFGLQNYKKKREKQCSIVFGMIKKV